MTPDTLELSANQPILACMNFCRASEVALLTAARLAESSGAPLVLLHVVHEPGNRPGYYRRAGNKDRLLPINELAERAFKEFLSNIRARHPGNQAALDRADTLLVEGLPETRIREVAQSIGAQLILIGSDGRGALARLYGGSVSDRVARTGSIPVTVVHAPRDDWDLAAEPTGCDTGASPLTAR